DDPEHRELARMLSELIAYRLDLLDGPLRHAVETRCLTAELHARALADDGPDEDAILRGYAEGLLLRTGQPVPLVRTTVRAMIPFHTAAQRAVGLSDGLARAAADGDTETQEWLGYVHDATIAEALAREGDRLLDDQPAHAGELYDAAA